MAFNLKTGYKRRIVGEFAAPAAVVISVRDWLEAALEANKVDLFANDSANIVKFLAERGSGNWLARDGWLDIGIATGGSVWIMTPYMYRDNVTPFAYHVYSAAQVQAFGIELTLTTARYYLQGLDLRDLIMYCAAATTKVNVDLGFM